MSVQKPRTDHVARSTLASAGQATSHKYLATVSCATLSLFAAHALRAVDRIRRPMGTWLSRVRWRRHPTEIDQPPC